MEETRYELRLYRQGTPTHRQLLSYAVNFVGHQGKQYGFLPNQDFEKIVGTSSGT